MNTMDLNSTGEKLGRQTLGESHDGNNINELSGDTVHIPDSGPNTCKKYILSQLRTIYEYQT